MYNWKIPLYYLFNSRQRFLKSKGRVKHSNKMDDKKTTDHKCGLKS